MIQALVGRTGGSSSWIEGSLDSIRGGVEPRVQLEA